MSSPESCCEASCKVKQNDRTVLVLTADPLCGLWARSRCSLLSALSFSSCLPSIAERAESFVCFLRARRRLFTAAPGRDGHEQIWSETALTTRSHLLRVPCQKQTPPRRIAKSCGQNLTVHQASEGRRGGRGRSGVRRSNRSRRFCGNNLTELTISKVLMFCRNVEQNHSQESAASL